MSEPVRAYRGEGPYVFVCWSHDDAAMVHRDIELLTSHGTNVWYDEGISAGHNWRREIATKLEGATRVLFYVSHHSLASDHCNREINYALDNGREVIPVYLEDVELTPDLKVGLGRVHALYRATDSLFERHLLEALAPGSSGERAPTTAVRRAPQGRYVIVAAALMVGIAATILLWREFAAHPSSSPLAKAPSIAVLPLTNLSGDPQDEYFGEGVSEEILNVLSRMEPLRVAARTSTFSFKDKDVGVKEIGRALDVANVLEGSVRRNGDRLRINVELIDAVSGFRIWSSSFDRNVQDIFAVQDEIAGAVARALRTTLSVDRVPGETTANIDAYNAFLKGRALNTNASEESNRGAITYLKRAVALDPEYAAAYGELAIAYGLYTTYAPFPELASDWSAVITRALEINPRDPNAIAAKALYVTLSDWDWPAAGELYRQARELGISSRAAPLYGTMYLAPLGKWEEARAFYTSVLDSDPFNVAVLWDFAEWATMEGHPAEAIESWNRILELQPQSADAWAGKAGAYAALRDQTGARDALAHVDLDRLNPWLLQHIVEARSMLGERDEVARLTARIEADAKRSVAHLAALTFTHLALRDRERTLDGFDAAYAVSLIGLLNVLRAPPVRSLLAGEPRYAELLRKTHLDDEYLRAAGLL